MEAASAKLTGLRVAPRKVRIVVDTIRGKPVDDALRILQYTRKAAAAPVAKLLRSAVANAEHAGIEVANLHVASIMVDQGPTLRRFMARAMGRGFRINKKTSHIKLELALKK